MTCSRRSPRSGASVPSSRRVTRRVCRPRLRTSASARPARQRRCRGRCGRWHPTFLSWVPTSTPSRGSPARGHPGARCAAAGDAVIADLDIKKLALEGGGFNLEPLKQAQASIPVVSQAFTAAKAENDGIQSDQLMDAVSGPVAEIRDVIDRTAPTLDVVNRYLPTLLRMAVGRVRSRT